MSTATLQSATASLAAATAALDVARESMAAAAAVADAIGEIQRHTPFGGWLQTWQGDGDGLYHAAIEGTGEAGEFVRGLGGAPLWGAGPTMADAIVALARDCRSRHLLRTG